MKMAMIEKERKITKIGNSLGVTLPKEILKHLNLALGDDIKFYVDAEGNVSVKKITPVDQDFLDGFKYAFENYDDALRNLADR